MAKTDLIDYARRRRDEEIKAQEWSAVSYWSAYIDGVLAEQRETKQAEEKLPNIKIYDNGNGYCVMVNGLISHFANSLGDAWRHVIWMHEVASQKFTVGTDATPVEEWVKKMKEFI